MPGTVEQSRLRIPLTPPQVVRDTGALRWRPSDGGRGPVVVLTHGAGTDVTSPILRAVGRGLAERGHDVVAFNLPYAEAGRKRPDPASRLLAAWRDAIAAVRGASTDDRPLVLGGRSMGGRYASMLAADDPGACAGLVLLNYPLHPAGRPAQLRTDHWPRLVVPVLFVHGDRDPLGSVEELERERAARLTGAPSTVHLVAGADHGFRVRKADARAPADVLAEVAGTVSSWLETLPSSSATS